MGGAQGKDTREGRRGCRSQFQITAALEAYVEHASGRTCSCKDSTLNMTWQPESFSELSKCQKQAAMPSQVWPQEDDSRCKFDNA